MIIIHRFCGYLLCCGVIFGLFSSVSYGSEYKEFIKIDSRECGSLSKKVVESQLPTEWHRYKDYLLYCQLKQHKQSRAKVAIVSVAQTYFMLAQKPLPVSERDVLGTPPLPIIVDNRFKIIGQLPEPYPAFDVTQPGIFTDSSDVNYGKWQSGIPTKILFDVYNPETKDSYYYEPLNWNEKSSRYEMAVLEKRPGTRPGALDPYAEGTEYEGFAKLNQDECVSVNNDKVFSRLPAAWHRYAGFIKMCILTQKKAPTTEVFVVSIWARDYIDAHPTDTSWEKFPLPIIVDRDFKQIGQLPEHYPFVEVTNPDIFFGKWQAGLPSEILIDVYNPAVGGDYHYEPLKWSKKSGRYEIKDLEAKDGKRPR